MPNLESTFRELTALPMFEFERPATETEIKDIEAKLGVCLPSQYVEFLKRFGYVAWFGHEIFGIPPVNRLDGHSAAIRLGCIAKTLEARDPLNQFGTSSLPGAHVVVATDGGGGHFVLYCEGAPRAGQVHWHNFESMTEPIRSWQTFQDYLKYHIDEVS